jgi:hypothetical protein
LADWRLLPARAWFHPAKSLGPERSQTVDARKKRTSPGVAIASAAASVLLAAHIWLHLGDYTAERGLLALVQIAVICAAFGAMVHLILETTLNAMERLFPGD